MRFRTVVQIISTSNCKFWGNNAMKTIFYLWTYFLHISSDLDKIWYRRQSQQCTEQLWVPFKWVQKRQYFSNECKWNYWFSQLWRAITVTVFRPLVENTVESMQLNTIIMPFTWRCLVRSVQWLQSSRVRRNFTLLKEKMLSYNRYAQHITTECAPGRD